MHARELIAILWEWTPFLAGGFLFNLLIAGLSMALGTAVGVGIGLARDSRLAPARGSAALATSVFRNVPSFVLMFYVAFVLPVEIVWAGSVFAIPLWIKATLALTIPVIGFASDQYLALRRQRREGQAGAGALFLTAWLQYFLIILMASATASVIGADEIVGRANRVIATDDRTEFLIATYVYVSMWFLIAGVALSWLAERIGGAVRARRAARAKV